MAEEKVIRVRSGKDKRWIFPDGTEVEWRGDHMRLTPPEGHGVQMRVSQYGSPVHVASKPLHPAARTPDSR